MELLDQIYDEPNDKKRFVLIRDYIEIIDSNKETLGNAFLAGIRHEIRSIAFVNEIRNFALMDRSKEIQLLCISKICPDPNHTGHNGAQVLYDIAETSKDWDVQKAALLQISRVRSEHNFTFLLRKFVEAESNSFGLDKPFEIIRIAMDSLPPELRGSMLNGIMSELDETEDDKRKAILKYLRYNGSARDDE